MIVIEKDYSVYTISGMKAEEWLYDKVFKTIEPEEDSDESAIPRQIIELVPKALPEGIKYVLDDDSELGKKIIEAGLLFEPIFDDTGELVDITPKEPEPMPEQPKILTNEEITKILSIMWG